MSPPTSPGVALRVGSSRLEWFGAVFLILTGQRECPPPTDRSGQSFYRHHLHPEKNPDGPQWRLSSQGALPGEADNGGDTLCE